jgi:hypothetical protein
MSKYHKANKPTKEQRRERKYKSRYGVSTTEYERLLAEQEGLCACCGVSEADFGGYLCVDHCHVTGRIRGLLCRKCNTAIGLLGDNLDGLVAAVAYLKKDL